jgi:hypothetical protein
MEHAEAWKRQDLARVRELEQELWRRPGGSLHCVGDELPLGLRVAAIDADRLQIIVDHPDGGQLSINQKQLLDVLSGAQTHLPEPTVHPLPTPVDYGQNRASAPTKKPPPGHRPDPNHPESQAFAAERQRIDDRRDQMSAVRPQTDIVEFEKMYWEQARASLALAKQVEAAGGLDPDPNGTMWGVKYVLQNPAVAADWEASTRAIYEHVKTLRDQGHPDEEIVAFLETCYGGPFDGPRPGV